MAAKVKVKVTRLLDYNINITMRLAMVENLNKSEMRSLSAMKRSDLWFLQLQNGRQGQGYAIAGSRYKRHHATRHGRKPTNVRNRLCICHKKTNSDMLQNSKWPSRSRLKVTRFFDCNINVTRRLPMVENLYIGASNDVQVTNRSKLAKYATFLNAEIVTLLGVQ